MAKQTNILIAGVLALALGGTLFIINAQKQPRLSAQPEFTNAISVDDAEDPAGAPMATNANPQPLEITPEALSELGPQLASAPQAKNSAMFSGVSQVSPQKIHELLPRAKGKPLLVEFKSRFCLDCKRMTPIIDQALKDFPKTEAMILDIQKDRGTRAKLFEAFNPTVVPVLVFVSPDGQIHHVFYGYHPANEIKAAFKAIQHRQSA